MQFGNISNSFEIQSKLVVIFSWAWIKFPMLISKLETYCNYYICKHFSLNYILKTDFEINLSKRIIFLFYQKKVSSFLHYQCPCTTFHSHMQTLNLTVSLQSAKSSKCTVKLSLLYLIISLETAFEKILLLGLRRLWNYLKGLCLTLWTPNKLSQRGIVLFLIDFLSSNYWLK